jgi:hypothetical protein
MFSIETRVNAPSSAMVRTHKGAKGINLDAPPEGGRPAAKKASALRKAADCDDMRCKGVQSKIEKREETFQNRIKQSTNEECALLGKIRSYSAISSCKRLPRNPGRFLLRLTSGGIG